MNMGEDRILLSLSTASVLSSPAAKSSAVDEVAQTVETERWDSENGPNGYLGETKASVEKSKPIRIELKERAFIIVDEDQVVLYVFAIVM